MSAERQQQIEARQAREQFEREEILTLAGSTRLSDRVAARKRIAALQADAARLSGLQDTLAEYVRLHEQHGRHAFPGTPQTLTDPLLDEALAALAASPAAREECAWCHGARVIEFKNGRRIECGPCLVRDEDASPTSEKPT